MNLVVFNARNGTYSKSHLNPPGYATMPDAMAFLCVERYFHCGIDMEILMRSFTRLANSFLNLVLDIYIEFDVFLISFKYLYCDEILLH